MSESRRKTRLEWLQEGLVLDQMGGEWEIGHAAAFCTVSESFIYRSQCPRIEKSGNNDVHGKPMLRFDPKVVRAWNASRTKKERAA